MFDQSQKNVLDNLHKEIETYYKASLKEIRDIQRRVDEKTLPMRRDALLIVFDATLQQMIHQMVGIELGDLADIMVKNEDGTHMQIKDYFSAVERNEMLNAGTHVAQMFHKLMRSNRIMKDKTQVHSSRSADEVLKWLRTI